MAAGATDKSILNGLSKINIRCLNLSSQLSFETLGIEGAERGWDIVFITGNTIGHSIVQLAELAKRRDWPLVGLVPGTDLNRNWSAAENLRLMLHLCDTTVMVNSNEKSDNSGLPQLVSSDIVSEICEGLANTSYHRSLRGMLKRGQFARVSCARSSSPNVEEAVLKALRAILPVAGFTEKTEVFLNISGPKKIDRKTLTRASRWISRALTPANAVICANSEEGASGGSVFLLVTQIAFPYLSPSSRNLSIDIDDLEPESSLDNGNRLSLELDQIELDEICH